MTLQPINQCKSLSASRLYNCNPTKLLRVVLFCLILFHNFCKTEKRFSHTQCYILRHLVWSFKSYYLKLLIMPVMKSYNKMMVVVGKTAEILVSPNLHAICISTDFTSMHVLVLPYTACDEYLIFPPKWTISEESNL